MKNQLLAVAITTVTCNQALSIDLDSPGSTPVQYASETVAPADGASTTVSETISSAAGFGITANTARFLRYDLPGTEFLAIPTLAVPGQTGSGIEYVGGGIDKDYVIFEVIADTATSILPTDTVSLSFGAASPNLKLEGETVVATYTQYFTAPGALNQNPADVLASSSGTLFAFTPGTGVDSTSTTTGTRPLEIDFASADTRFVGGDTRSAIGAFYATEVPGDQFLLDGITDITIAASRTINSRLRVTGDFTATIDPLTGAYFPDRVFLSNDGCDSSILDAESLTAEEAVLSLGNTAYGTITVPRSLSSGPDVCIQVNGDSPIPEADYTAHYEPEAASGFNLSDKSFALGSLRKNSATDTKNLVLTPQDIGGLYESYIRVTNTSAFDGDVFFRLINDLGEIGPSVLLADVLGSSSSTLASAGSTEPIEIGRIYAASIAADPSWAIGSEPLSKLRLVTTGDFTSIVVTLISLSQDETLIDTY